MLRHTQKIQRVLEPRRQAAAGDTPFTTGKAPCVFGSKRRSYKACIDRKILAQVRVAEEDTFWESFDRVVVRRRRRAPTEVDRPDKQPNAHRQLTKPHWNAKGDPEFPLGTRLEISAPFSGC